MSAFSVSTEQLKFQAARIDNISTCMGDVRRTISDVLDGISILGTDLLRVNLIATELKVWKHAKQMEKLSTTLEKISKKYEITEASISGTVWQYLVQQVADGVVTGISDLIADAQNIIERYFRQWVNMYGDIGDMVHNIYIHPISWFSDLIDQSIPGTGHQQTGFSWEASLFDDFIHIDIEGIGGATNTSQSILTMLQSWDDFLDKNNPFFAIINALSIQRITRIGSEYLAFLSEAGVNVGYAEILRGVYASLFDANGRWDPNFFAGFAASASAWYVNVGQGISICGIDIILGVNLGQGAGASAYIMYDDSILSALVDIGVFGEFGGYLRIDASNFHTPIPTLNAVHDYLRTEASNFHTPIPTLNEVHDYIASGGLHNDVRDSINDILNYHLW